MKHQAYSGKILKSIVFYSVLQLIILRVHLNLRFFRDSVEKKKKIFWHHKVDLNIHHYH